MIESAHSLFILRYSWKPWSHIIQINQPLELSSYYIFNMT
jgi:hypothetical protein